MDVLLLLPEKVEGYGVEGVGAQLVVPHEDQQQVEQHASLHIDRLVLPSAHLLRLDHRLLDLRLGVRDAAQVGEIPHAQMPRPIYQIRQVEVINVVPGDDIRVRFADKHRPAVQQVRFAVARIHVRADNLGASVQREHVPDEGLPLALDQRCGTVELIFTVPVPVLTFEKFRFRLLTHYGSGSGSGSGS